MLQIEGIRKEFSGGAVPVVALEAVDLAIERGEFVTLVGPSGCGKSSLLTLISGLSPPSSGRIRIDGREIAGTDREVGFITQQDNLFPWRTLIDNVALSLELAGVGAGRAPARGGALDQARRPRRLRAGLSAPALRAACASAPTSSAR